MDRDTTSTKAVLQALRALQAKIQRLETERARGLDECTEMRLKLEMARARRQNSAIKFPKVRLCGAPPGKCTAFQNRHSQTGCDRPFFSLCLSEPQSACELDQSEKYPPTAGGNGC